MPSEFKETTMENKFKLRKIFLLAISLVMLCYIANVVAKEGGLLDGKVYVGQSKEKHKKNFKEDELIFKNGKINSIDHVQSGFNEGVYTAIEEGDRIFFEAEIVSKNQGKIKWRGIVHGDSIEVDYSWSKKGWLSDTIKEFSFNGTLKN